MALTRRIERLEAAKAGASDQVVLFQTRSSEGRSPSDKIISAQIEAALSSRQARHAGEVVLFITEYEERLLR